MKEVFRWTLVVITFPLVMLGFLGSIIFYSVHKGIVIAKLVCQALDESI